MDDRNRFRPGDAPTRPHPGPGLTHKDAGGMAPADFGADDDGAEAIDGAVDEENATEFDVQGEGDYRSARRFQQAQHAFAADGAAVATGGRAAADALEGPEADELERARRASAKGESA